MQPSRFPVKAIDPPVLFEHPPARIAIPTIIHSVTRLGSHVPWEEACPSNRQQSHRQTTHTKPAVRSAYAEVECHERNQRERHHRKQRIHHQPSVGVTKREEAAYKAD